MALNRADYLTGSRRQSEFFSDFLNNMNMTPYGNDLGKVSNSKSVNQSLRNIVKTNLGERLFNPDFGGNVYASLFELIDSQDFRTIEIIIEKTIIANEPRVILEKVLVEQQEEDENAITVSIQYNLINNPEPITLELLLKRVR
jgi:phage baseplate assembly protein W